MRKWYGKWALRYSVLYFFLGALLFPVTKFGFAPLILILMFSVALTSHLHLWPVLRKSYLEQKDVRRVRYGKLAGFVLWTGLFALVFLIDQRTAFLAGGITASILLGPPMMMLEVYALRLNKGDVNDSRK